MNDQSVSDALDQWFSKFLASDPQNNSCRMQYTECILFGDKIWPSVVQELYTLAPYCGPVVKNLGVMFDDCLNFDRLTVL